jgi:hypothetical protein
VGRTLRRVSLLGLFSDELDIFKVVTGRSVVGQPKPFYFQITNEYVEAALISGLVPVFGLHGSDLVDCPSRKILLEPIAHVVDVKPICRHRTIWPRHQPSTLFRTRQINRPDLTSVVRCAEILTDPEGGEVMLQEDGC